MRDFGENYALMRGSELYELAIGFRVNSWGRPGSRDDPPEDLELELVNVWLKAPPWAKGRYSFDLIPFALTDKEREQIETWLYENSEPEDDYDD